MSINNCQDLGVDTQVAQHLAATYGDRAFSVGKMASLTGKRWPIVGKRIHMEFPYIDAEVEISLNIYLLIFYKIRDSFFILIQNKLLKSRAEAQFNN